MAQLTDLFPAADLQAELDAGYVLRKQHPTLPLSLYVYGRACQYENHWTPVTMRCRGLVVDDTDGRIVAWCLPKFYNHDQHGKGHDFAPPLPDDEPFEIFDKVDGCFSTNMTLNLWGGGTITIGEVVRRRLPVTLVGMDAKGNLVPALVTDWHRNGRKDDWLDITVDSPVARGTGAGGNANRIRVTPNHHIRVNGEYKTASGIRPGDELVTQGWQPSAEVLRLVRASLLGDGCVTPATSKASLAAKYQEAHSLEQAGYVGAIRKALAKQSYE